MFKRLLLFTLSISAFLEENFSSAQDQRCNGVPSINWSCCSSNEPCGVGGGDCDRDSDCLGSFKCGNNNCQADFPGDASWPTSADCCYDPGNNCRGDPSTDWNCCSDAFPCTAGGGDCDEDSQCEGNLVCGSDNCFRDFSSTGSNWVAGADCCRANSEYTKSSDQGACCVSGGQHAGCMVHSSFATVTEATCRAACDNDAHCKGYSINDANGGMFCRLATAVSQCPHNWDIVQGLSGTLDSTESCATEYDGCYVKDNWSTPGPTTSGPIPTQTARPTTARPTTTVPTTTTAQQTAANITIDCDSPFDEVTDSGTTITSPNYPSNYDNSKDCQVTIRFAAEQIVSITLEAFNVESHSTCTWDYLAVHDGDSTSSSLIGSKLCGTSHEGSTIQSTGNTMTLHFHTDGSVTRSGFKINVNSATAPPTTTPGPTVAPPSGGCGVRPSRIVGGSEASAYSLPWQVGLVTPGNDAPFCGGTLIGPRHVLTAAHCTGWNGGNWDVMVGEHRISDSSDGTRHTKCRHVDHPQYNNPRRFSNDFAIVHLNSPVQLGARANTACLPTSAHGGSFLDDKTLTTSGWGSLCSGCSSPDVLHVVDTPGVSNAVCDTAYGGTGSITDEMICAGNTVNGGVDACQGDSGGPLTYLDQGRAVLVGVVSWGRGCALATHPGVYARTTEALSWINDQMSQTC